MTAISSITNTTLESRQTTGDCLIDMMDLVESRERFAVPNYLLETKVYCRISRNAIVQAQPSEVHFAGFKVGHAHQQQIRFINVSSEVTRFHILPPETPYFKVKYTKQERLVPGFSVDCVVEFIPNEMRYYYDALRIHSKDEENNLVIPIHAYPVLGLKDFPEFLKFPDVPVGHKATKVIPIQSRSQVDFEFEITIVHDNSAFKVEPLCGVLPAGEVTNINVTFAPFDFVTAQLSFEFSVSEFNFKPRMCHISGYSEPGQERRKVKAAHGDTEAFPDAAVLDPRVISPLDRSRTTRKPPPGGERKTKEQLKQSKPTVPKQAGQSAVVERNGFRIPANLDSPAAVAAVLNQKPGKLSMKELREIMNRRENLADMTRQMKEAIFEQEVRQDVYEERQNQLRWQVKLGENPMGSTDREIVLAEREDSFKRYKQKRGDPLVDEELSRRKAAVQQRRTHRIPRADNLELTEAEEATLARFDRFANNLWHARQDNLERFRQAARRVIIYMRADKKIPLMKRLVADFAEGRLGMEALTSTSELDPTELNERLDDVEPPAPSEPGSLISISQVGAISFATTEAWGAETKKAETSTSHVTVPVTEIIIRRMYPYCSLAVPQQWRLAGYSKMVVHDCASGYVPLMAPRKLVSGGEDEVITIPLPAELQAVSEYDIEEIHIPSDTSLSATIVRPKPEEDLAVVLQPPPALFEPIHYPPLHVFNPSPGLQVFEQTMNYAETDPDFRLCPLPRYTARPESASASTQKRFMDRTEVIRGVMTWRKFASPSLTALTHAPTLTAVWMPRWTDPFSDTMLPQHGPHLVEGLSPEDTENIVEEEGSVSSDDQPLLLTPAMLDTEFPYLERHRELLDQQHNMEVHPEEVGSSQEGEVFPLGEKLPPSNVPVSAHGPVPRWTREKELDFFLNRKSNRLGTRITDRVNQLDSLIEDEELHLK